MYKLLNDILEGHYKIDYNRILSKHCPLPENWGVMRKMLLIASRGPDRKQVYLAIHERLNTPIEQIVHFTAESVFKLLPANLFVRKNARVLRKKIAKFCRFNHYESFTRGTLMQGFKASDIEFLKFSACDDNAAYFERENEFVVYRLLKWIFEEYIVTLQRCFFYATEKQKEYSRVYFYRKPLWNLVMQMAVEDLVANTTLKTVSKAEMQAACENNNLAPGKLRLIPKKDTFRPIMTFNRKLPQSKTLTTNKKLATSHMMLKHLKTRMFLSDFGFAVFNYDDIMRKYERFVQKWRAQGTPDLYFVTMDIEKCYDNVDEHRLVSFLRETSLLEKEYYVLNLYVLKRRLNVVIDRQTFKKRPLKTYFKHKFHKLCIDGAEYPSLADILSKENDFNLKRTIIVEEESRRKYTSRDLLAPVTHICLHNYLTFNKKQYRQVRGIPQGLCLSYILSSFYYASLEEQALGFLKNEDCSLLMRLTDDYLLMTSSKDSALLAIEQVERLSRSGWFKIQVSKLKTSFVVDLHRVGLSDKREYGG